MLNAYGRQCYDLGYEAAKLASGAPHRTAEGWRPTKWHELKTWPEFFEEVVSGRKMFEIRENDRDFRVGDGLWLREYTLGVGLSGRDARYVISYMTDWKQQPRYVVLGLSSAPGITPPQEEL